MMNDSVRNNAYISALSSVRGIDRIHFVIYAVNTVACRLTVVASVSVSVRLSRADVGQRSVKSNGVNLTEY